MASQETLINECRALCIDGTATRENIWAKCSTLGQHWSEADSDETINVAITQIDEIVATNNTDTQLPFTLALLMIRAELEQALTVNNHVDQSTTFYFGHINTMMATTAEFEPPLKKRKNFVANLGKLLALIRNHLLSKRDEAMELVKQVIVWLDVPEPMLTPFHQTICMLGLANNSPESVSTVTSTMFKFIHPSLQDIKDYLLFHYYSAILLGMQQNWKQMHFNLEQVISVPSNAHSQIIIDAYKKYTLICFLRGICIKSTLPRYATQSRQQQELSPSHQVHTIIKNSQPQSQLKSKGICNIKQYHSFVFKCLKGDNEETALAEVSQLLQQDKNYTLAKMAIKENKKRKVKKMTQIYITAKLSDIAQRVEMSSEKTLRLLNEMRDSGELRTLVEGEIVVFEQKQEDNEEKLFQEMEALEQRTQCLKDSIDQLDRTSVTHAKHVLHLI